MPIILHVLNADGRLGDIQPAVEAAPDRVDVLLCNEPNSTVPELGLGGHSPNGSRCFLFIDSADPRLRASLTMHFTSLLAHELRHCLRRRGPGYDDNMLPEALVSEGLACHFEAEVMRRPLPIHATSLAASELGAALVGQHMAASLASAPLVEALQAALSPST